MIHIDKLADPRTTRMKNRATDQVTADCDLYDLDEASYHRSDDTRNKLAIVESIYKATGVKNALMDASYLRKDRKIGKCYFCESYAPRRDLHIEHYRPKNGFKRSEDDAEEYPGYHWLAYDWDNLLLGCSECNGIKDTNFPIRIEANRIRRHREKNNIGGENPMLINPAEKGGDPRDFIRFLDDAPFSGRLKGRRTIKLLRLDGGEPGKERPFLKERRYDLWQSIKFKRKIYEQFKSSADPDRQKLANEAREFLEKAILPESEFSSMAQDFLADWTP